MKRYPIGIDAHSLRGRRTGVANYVHDLINGLARVAPHGEVELFTNGPLNETFGFREKIVKGKPFWTTLWLGNHFLFHRDAPEVMLYPAHGMPWYSPAKNVVTVHDLAFEIFPDHFTASDLRRLRRLTRSSVRRADHLIAVSKSAAADIVRLYGVEEEKITVIYHGCDHEVFKPRPEVEAKKVREKYRLNKPYLISVGTLQKRKNHLGLVRAWEDVRRKGHEVDLVLVGAKGWLSDELMEALDSSPYKESVHRLGFVETEELPLLYQGALMFVLPSLYEGFGLPVLEAMACGTPVITSNNSSLGELFGGTAMIIDPLNRDELSGAIIKLMSEEKLRDKLRSDGLELAAKFSWTETAKKTYDLLMGLRNERR